MNPCQMAQQIKDELQAVVWADGAADVVFGARSVFVFAGVPPNEDTIPPGFPFALVTIDSGSMDEDHPELISQGFTIISAAEVAGDPLGEFAVIGGSRANMGKSAGAGVAEVAERVRAAVQDLTGYDGAKVLLSAAATGAPAALGQGRHIAFDELSLTALCTSQPHYAAPQELVRSGDNWTFEGAQCSSRFDFLQFRLMYKSGSAPGETPADMTASVWTGTSEVFTYSPTGSRTYSLFADYAPRGGAVVVNSSKGNLVGTYVSI